MALPLFNIYSSICTMVVMSFDRLRVMVRGATTPKNHALMAILFTWVLSLVLTAPQFYEYSLVEKGEEGEKETELVCSSAAFKTSKFVFKYAVLSFVFAGYGHSTPQTIGGKIFCMFYAISGIPLCIVMFQSVGERLNTFVTFLLKTIKKVFKLKSTEVSQTNLILIALNLSTIVLTTGAAAFRHFEGWVYIDSFYYCFITLTTIGFGDFVALQQNDMLTNQVEYVAFSIIFILFGLTVISAAMNLLILRFLTMNTVDERREEMEAAAAARGAVRLDGDVITGQANGNVVSNAQETPEYNDLVSVCSCSCYNLRSSFGGGGDGGGGGRRSKGKPRYSVVRAPGKIQHLLPLTGAGSGGGGGGGGKEQDTISVTEDSASFLAWQQQRNSKRASI
ncbi:two pore potassium channel protein sup-9-like [Littorina saxatilis]|uniref:two pore potassium channel protein sup-9-like n=1 Tax=Littorina saxatilis TaxID=31220 RepID=UPI0038B447B2